MKIFGALAGLLLWGVTGLSAVFVIRICVHHFAFWGMSKTRKKKILKELSFQRRMFMFYALKYNCRKRTIFCIFCYYIFCICLIMSLYFISANVFMNFHSISWLSSKCVGRIMFGSFTACY